jgi:hypothetical protein
MYHIASGLAVLAVACGSKVSWHDHGDSEVWPNLYMLVVGTTGVGKTTSTNIGVNLLRRSIPDSVISDEFTPEALVRELAQNPSSLLYVEEFGTLLAATGKAYNADIKPMLTKLYDNRESFKRAVVSKDSGGSQYIPRPALSMLAGSTVDWLVQHLQEADFRSGFMPRVLLFPQDDTDLEPEPEVSMYGTRDERLYQALRLPIQKLGVMKSAPVMFSQDAVKYRRIWTDAQGGSSIIAANEDMRGMVQRISSTVFKVAALLCVSDYGVQQRYVVNLDTTKRAAQLVAWLIQHSVHLFDRYILFEKFEKDAQLCLEWITDDGISRPDLMRFTRKPLNEFDRIMDTLVQRGDVEKYQYRPDGSTKAVLMYRRVYRPVAEIAVLMNEEEDRPESQLEMKAV